MSPLLAIFAIIVLPDPNSIVAVELEEPLVVIHKSPETEV